ncbi:MAG TPA: hypothetical protein VFL83_04870 [Anaeromyxobacter sp.]|nr:hypothetical protein [Anaeromyxobacter sp.]
MSKKRLPDLSDTGRRYVENTIRARLQSPGVERYPRSRRRGGGRVALAALLVAALVGAMIWFAR